MLPCAIDLAAMLPRTLFEPSTPRPSQRSSKEATFTALREDFKLAEPMKKGLMASPVEDLEDLRFFFAEESEIEPWVAAIPDYKDMGGGARLQVARMRRCWTCLRSQGKERDSRPAHPAAPDLDDLLEEKELREVKVNFWRRYHVKFPADLHPSDQLISRGFRELSMRVLTVYDIGRVKTLMHQVSATRKRRGLRGISTSWRTSVKSQGAGRLRNPFQPSRLPAGAGHGWHQSLHRGFCPG